MRTRGSDVDPHFKRKGGLAATLTKRASELLEERTDPFPTPRTPTDVKDVNQGRRRP